MPSAANTAPVPRASPKKTQDFSEVGGTSDASRQSLIAKNWDYLPALRLSRFRSLSTSLVGSDGSEHKLDPKSGQFEMALG